MTFYGPGGIGENDRALLRRDIHPSHKGRLCPVETPESEKIGLTLHLAAGATVRDRKIIPGSNEFLGLAALLIPFIPHDDANRVLMGGKNLKQALPLLYPEQPLVKTGFEETVARLSGRSILAKNSGEVIKVTPEKVEIRRDKDYGRDEYRLSYFKPTSHDTVLFHRPCVNIGDHMDAGKVIADGAAMKNGDLSLGVNLFVAYMPYYGYNFEDGIVISDRLVREDILTSLHIEEVCIELEKDEITFHETPRTQRMSYNHLDKDGVIKVGTEVAPGTVLVQKYKEFDKLGEHEAPLKWIQGKDYIKKPAVVRAGRDCQGKVVNVFKRRGIIKICILTERRVQVGDKLMGRHGNKGVISRIVPMEEMPHLADGTTVDVILNPHGVISRMNLGQLLETHLGLLLKKKGEKQKVVKPFEMFDIDDLRKDLELRGFPGGKATLYDGRTGKPYKNPIVTGYQYIVKLNHLSEEKLHSRLTGEYNIITQQALRGKRQNGGQRIGEMEVWALLAHKADRVLQEFLTVKSDEVEGRDEAIKILMEEGIDPDLMTAEARLPETFKVLQMFLKGLGYKLYFEQKVEEKKGTRLKGGFELLAPFIDTPENIEELKIDWATEDEIEAWGKAVKGGRITESIVSGKISCGCEGKLKEKLISLSPLICKIHGRMVVLPCGCTGNFVEITEKKGSSYVCKNEKAHEDNKFKLGKITIDKQKDKGLKVIARREFESFCDDGLFSEKIFGEDGKDIRRRSIGIVQLADDMGHPLSRDLNGEYLRSFIFLPVIPPDLRPILAGKKGGSELNRLYQRVINQNNRLKDLLVAKKSGASVLDDDINQEKEILQVYLDQLMTDGLEEDGRRYRSLEEFLKGKYGLFRQALLGKRVDASGRAVIVPDPSIPIDHMALPYDIAIDLFKPWLIHRLMKDYTKEKWDAEECLIKSHDSENKKKILLSIQRLIDDFHLVVLLNRPPSLHKYNLLSFTPVVKEQMTIGLHPLVCAGFNADFDGDQMALFIPWMGQKEARERLSPLQNILSVANGAPLLDISQDIVSGMFLKEKKDKKKINLDLFKEYIKGDEYKFADFAEGLMRNGFYNATEQGLTFSLWDLDSLWVKKDEREKILSNILNRRVLSLLTDQEQIDILDKLVKEVNKEIGGKLYTEAGKKNPVAVMTQSGARGDAATITQLAGLRGLMERTGGGASVEPVLTNFREGLSPEDFFTSCYGSRKSLVDKKLKVADAGDLTRRMVYCGYDWIITEEDCDDQKGIVLKEIKTLPHEEDKKVDRLPWKRRVVGRISLEDIQGTSIKKEDVIDEAKAEEADNRGIREIRVRSVLTCKAKDGFCKKCYGWDLSKRDFPETGLPVGIIAAQSIGERGTQLSMRTFHTGGVKGEDITHGLPRVKNILENRPVPLTLYTIKKKKGSNLTTGEGVHEWDIYREIEKIEDKAEFPEYDVVKIGERIESKKLTLQEVFDINKDLNELLTFILREMHRAYKGDVQDKHFEVILRSMMRKDKDGNWKIRGITKSASSAEDFLAAATFQRATEVIKEAANKKRGSLLRGLRQKILLGGYFNLKERE